MNILDIWLDYLDAQVGRGVYVWGAQGERADQVGDVRSFIERKSTSTSAARRAWAFYQKLSETLDASEISFFDCSGLAMYFFRDSTGISKNDLTAHGIWKGCKRREGALKPGDFVFRESGGRMTHIGFVARDGQIVEARKSGAGIEKRPFEAGGWTCAGRHKWLDDAPSPNDVYRLQTLILFWNSCALPKWGADGEYGAETETAARELIKYVSSFLGA